MKKHLILLISIITFFILPSSGVLIGSDFQLKEYNDMNSEMSRYLQSAKNASSELEWNMIVQKGKAALVADWENEANEQIETQIETELEEDSSKTESEIREELQTILNNAKAALETEIDREIFAGKGEWLAEVILIVKPSFDREGLTALISGESRVDDGETLDAAFQRWNDSIGAMYDTLWTGYTADLDDSRNKAIEDALIIIGDTGEARDRFILALDKRLNDLKTENKLEEDIYLLKQRNDFFYTYTHDTDSLRRETEAASAQAITGRILDDTTQETDDLMNEALYIGSDEYTGSLESLSPEELEERIKSFIDTGLATWKRAEERLLGARLDWERKVLEDYDTANTVWEDAYKELQENRAKWFSDIRQQVFEGEGIWENRIDEMNDDFQDSLDELDRYIGIQEDSWDEYSENMRDMITSGSSAIYTAKENLGWLTEYKADLDKKTNKNANDLAILSKINDQIDSWTNIISRFENILTTAEMQYHYMDMNGEMEEIIDEDGNKILVVRNTGLLTDDSFDEYGNPLYIKYDEDGSVLYYGINNDPYLMTKAEYDLEVLKIQQAYWAERLERARRVKEYACDEYSRLSKEEQEAVLEAARTAYNDKKAEYDTAVNDLSVTISTALDNAKDGLTTSKDELETAKAAFESARAVYQDMTKTYYLLTNDQAAKIAEKELTEATSKLVEINNMIDGKEQEWLAKSREYYSVLSVQGKSDEAVEYAKRLKAAIEIYEGNGADLSGARVGYETIKSIMERGLDSIDDTDGILEGIEANRNVLFNGLPKGPLGDNVSYIESARTEIDTAVNSYDATSMRYRDLNNILSSSDDNENKVKKAILEILNPGGNNNSITDENIQGRYDKILETSGIISGALSGVFSSDETIRDGAIEKLCDMTDDLITEVGIKAILESADISDKEKAIEDLLFNKLKTLYSNTGGVSGIIGDIALGNTGDNQGIIDFVRLMSGGVKESDIGLLTDTGTDPQDKRALLEILFYKGIAKQLYGSDDDIDAYDPDSFYSFVLENMNEELYNRKLTLQDSIVDLNNSIETAYRMSGDVVKYLLTDMRTPASGDTTTIDYYKIDSITARYNEKNDVLPSLMTAYNLDITKQTGNMLTAFTGEESDLYKQIISQCKTNIEATGSNTEERSRAVAVYRYILQFKSTITGIESKSDNDEKREAYTEFLTGITDMTKALEHVNELYSTILKDKTSDEIQKVVNEYTVILSNNKAPEKDSDGNTRYDADGNIIFTDQVLSDDEKLKLSVLLTELVSPGSFDLFGSSSKRGLASSFIDKEAALALCLYADKFYDKSFENREKFKNEGVFDMIAGILGISEDDDRDDKLEAIKDGNLSYETLSAYGESLTDYMKGEEYEDLPASMKAALEDAASKYRLVLSAKVLYDNRDRDVSDITAEKEKAEELYADVMSLIEGYNSLIQLKEQATVTAGAGKNTTDMFVLETIINKLNLLEEQYNETRDKIDDLELKEDFDFPLFSLSTNIKQLRDEYRLLDYTGRYFGNIEYFTSLDDYRDKLISKAGSAYESSGYNLDDDFAGAVIAEIMKRSYKNDILKSIEQTNPENLEEYINEKKATIPDGLFTDEETDELFGRTLKAAYVDAIYNGLYDMEKVDLFDATIFDESYMDFALLLHFREYLRKEAFESSSLKSFDVLFGRVDSGGDFNSGLFTGFSQYESISGDTFISLYDDMRGVYSRELSNLVLTDTSLDETDIADVNPDGDFYNTVLFFEKYIQENAGDSPDFDSLFIPFTELDTFTGGSFDYNTLFDSNRETFEYIFQKLTGDETLKDKFLALNLPPDAALFEIESEFYSMNLMRSEYSLAFLEMNDFLASYDIDLLAAGLNETEIDEYGNIVKLAFGYNREGSESIEDYIKRNDITDTKEQNYLRLHAIDPNLASIEYLKDSSGIVEFQLADYLLTNTLTSLFSKISEEQNGESIMTKLSRFADEYRDEAWLKGETAEMLANGSEYYKNYRDFLNEAETYFESGSGTDLSLFQQIIVEKEKLVQADNPETIHYYDTNDNQIFDDGDINLTETWKQAEENKNNNKGMIFWIDPIAMWESMPNYRNFELNYYYDENNDGSWDAGEKTLNEFMTEYREAGKDLNVLKKEFTGIEHLYSDLMRENTISYYTDSFVNNLLEEMTEFNKSLLMLITAGEVESLDMENLEITKDEENNYIFGAGGDFGATGLYDISMLSTAVRERAGTTITHDDNLDLSGSLADISTILDVIINEQGDNANVATMIGTVMARSQVLQAELANSKETIKRTGHFFSLKNNDIEKYIEKIEDAQVEFQAWETTFHNAADSYAESETTYRDAQEDYINQLDLISMIYEELEEARKNREIEEAVYEYATTSYLYNTESNADGGNNELDGLKSDALEEYNQVRDLHEEIEELITAQEETVAETKAQNVLDDVEYNRIVAELKDKADRAFRMEKLKVHMEMEVNKRSDEYIIAKEKYEQAREDFITPVNDNNIDRDKRNKFVDRFIDSDYLDGNFSRDVREAAHHYNRTPDRYASIGSPIFTVSTWFGKGPSDHWNRAGDWLYNTDSPFLEYFKYIDVNAQLLNENSTFVTLFQKHLEYKDDEASRDNHLNFVRPFAIGATVAMTTAFVLSSVPIWGGALSLPFWATFAALSITVTAETIIINGLESEMNAASSIYNKNFNELNSELKNIQQLKADMLKKQASLAELTQVEILDSDMSYSERVQSGNTESGIIRYYDPGTSSYKTITKMTLKEAYENIAANAVVGYRRIPGGGIEEIKGFDLKEGDLEYLVSGTASIEEVNINEHTELFDIYDEAGYLKEFSVVYDSEGNELTVESLYDEFNTIIGDGMVYDAEGSLLVIAGTCNDTVDELGRKTTSARRSYYNAATIAGTYANHLESRRFDKLTEYFNHTDTMMSDNYMNRADDDDSFREYDRVVVDRAREKLLYELFASDSSIDDNFSLADGFDSAYETGRDFEGYIRASVEYFGALEGFDINMIRDLEAMIDNPDAMLQAFNELRDQCVGINDRELEQRRSLQLIKWSLKQDEFAEKKQDWDKKISQIFERGARQWANMEDSFYQQWKQWRRESEERIIAGQEEWDGKWSSVKDKKAEWLKAIGEDAGSAMVSTRLSDIDNLVNGMIGDINDRYGDVISDIDVRAILDDILKETPELIPQELFDEIENIGVDFAVTELSSRSYDRQVFAEYDSVTDQFEDEIRKTQNLRLIRTMTELLDSFSKRMVEMDENAADGAQNYAASHGYSLQGGRYVRTKTWTHKFHEYRSFNYDQEKVFPQSSFDELLTDMDDMPDWEFDAKVSIAMKEMEVNFEGLLDDNNPESLPSHVGEFPEYKEDPGMFEDKLKNKGSAEYGRIGMEIEKDNNKNATVMASLNIGRAVASIWSGYGGVLIAGTELSSQAASGEITGDEAMFEIIKQGVISLACRGVDKLAGVTKAAGAVSSTSKMVAAVGKGAINFGARGVKYNNQNGLSFGFTDQDMIMGGLSFVSSIGSQSMGLNLKNGEVNWGGAVFSGAVDGIGSGFKFDRDGNYKGFGLGTANLVYGAASATGDVLSSYATGVDPNDPKNGDTSKDTKSHWLNPDSLKDVKMSQVIKQATMNVFGAAYNMGDGGSFYGGMASQNWQSMSFSLANYAGYMARNIDFPSDESKSKKPGEKPASEAVLAAGKGEEYGVANVLSEDEEVFNPIMAAGGVENISNEQLNELMEGLTESLDDVETIKQILAKKILFDMSQNGGSQNIFDINHIIAKQMDLSAQDSMDLLKDAAGVETARDLQRKLSSGEVSLNSMIDSAGIGATDDLISLGQQYADISKARIGRNEQLRQKALLEKNEKPSWIAERDKQYRENGLQPPWENNRTWNPDGPTRRGTGVIGFFENFNVFGFNKALEYAERDFDKMHSSESRPYFKTEEESKAYYEKRVEAWENSLSYDIKQWSQENAEKYFLQCAEALERGDKLDAYMYGENAKGLYVLSWLMGDGPKPESDIAMEAMLNIVPVGKLKRLKDARKIGKIKKFFQSLKNLGIKSKEVQVTKAGKYIDESVPLTKYGAYHQPPNIKHNNAIEKTLRWAENSGASSLRKNKKQVDILGDAVSSKRPDASYILDGKRYNMNYISNYELNKIRELQRELKNFKEIMKADPGAINSLIFKYK